MIRKDLMYENAEYSAEGRKLSGEQMFLQVVLPILVWLRSPRNNTNNVANVNNNGNANNNNYNNTTGGVRPDLPRLLSYRRKGVSEKPLREFGRSVRGVKDLFPFSNISGRILPAE